MAGYSAATTRGEDSYRPYSPLPLAPRPPPSNLSITKSFRPYYSPTEITLLIRLQAGAHSSRSTAPLLDSNGQRKELSEAKVEQWRQLACGYIERVGARLGFPRRTIATAQTLYHRFHLHFPLKDFPYHDVSLSALLVSSKLEDTLKKLREIQIAGWQVLNLLEGGPGTGEGDSTVQEAHRPNLIAIERLLLQTICFNFNLHRSLAPSSLSTSTSSTPLPASLVAALSSPATTSTSPTGRDIFTYVHRISRSLFPTSFDPASPPPTTPFKPFTYLAHLLAIDLNRTTMPLSYPPHTCAVACLYLASFLWKGSLEWKSWQGDGEEEIEGEDALGLKKGWVEELESREEDVQEISHALLDLLILLCPPSTTPLSTSTLLTNPSPSFSNPSPLSTLASPAADAPLPLPSTTPGGYNSLRADREKHLLQTGVPASLSLGWGGWLGGGAVGGSSSVAGPAGSGESSVMGVKGVEDLTRVKIRLRELGALIQGSSGGGAVRRKRIRSTVTGGEEQEEEGGRRAKLFGEASHWVGGVEGMREVERLQRERGEREVEREQEREALAAGVEGGVDATAAPGEGRSGREKKPSSVRYRF